MEPDRTNRQELLEMMSDLSAQYEALMLLQDSTFFPSSWKFEKLAKLEEDFKEVQRRMELLAAQERKRREEEEKN